MTTLMEDRFLILTRCLPAIILAASILTYWLTLFRYATNIPNADDFDVFLKFLVQYRESDSSSLLEAIGLVFMPHNEHFIVFNRLLALCCYFLFGTLNFKSLILLGNIALLVISFVLFQALRPSANKRLLLFTPVVVALFQPQYVEASVWATAAISNFWVLAFVVLALWWNIRGRMVLSFVAALFASFTLGNGFLCFLVLAVLNMLQSNFRRATLMFSVFCILALVQLHHHAGDVLKGSSLLGSLGQYLDYTLSFLGSAVSGERHIFACFSGIGFVAYFLWLWRRGYPQRNPLYFGLLLFLLLSALANAIARAHFGIEISFQQSRYKFVSLMVVVLVYLSMMEILERKVLVVSLHVLSLFGTMAGSIYSYVSNQNQLQLRWELLNDSMLRWQIGRTGLAYPQEEVATRILDSAMKHAIYLPLSVNLPSFVTKQVPMSLPKRSSAHLRLSIDHFIEGKDYLEVDGWAVSLPRDREEAKIYLVLKGQKLTYAFETNRRTRPDVTSLLKEGNHDSAGFFSLIRQEEIAVGNYIVGVVLVGEKYRYLGLSDRIFSKRPSVD